VRCNTLAVTTYNIAENGILQHKDVTNLVPSSLQNFSKEYKLKQAEFLIKYLPLKPTTKETKLS